MALLPDGATLAVANGGILTLPETGRDMLNLDTMRPSLNYVELASGRLCGAQVLAPDLHHLSIRHLAQSPDGMMAAGLEWEGDRDRLVPLVAIDRGAARSLRWPPLTRPWRTLAAYVGSVAFDRIGELLAASCPRGNRIAFWRTGDGCFLRKVEVLDGCAIGPSATPGRFLVASSIGTIAEVDPGTGEATPLGTRAPVGYDNHLTMLG
jgi:hypothetical protein